MSATSIPGTVVETAVFSRQAASVWDDGELMEFILFIALNPETGDLIPGTGGIRKVRWSRAGTGKRGGTRVIYLYHQPEAPLLLLMVYPKGRKENLTAHEKKILRGIAMEAKKRMT